MMFPGQFTLERIEEPDIEPVTLDEMRVHLRIYDDDHSEDDEINTLISAARQWAEDYTGRVLIEQSWRLSTGQNIKGLSTTGDTVAGLTSVGLSTGVNNQFVNDGIWLRKSPVLAITSFVSVDTAGVETAIDAATYELRDANSKWPRLYGLNGATWTGPLRIEYRAGYADRLGSPMQGAEMVPARFKHAMKIWCDAMYDRDERTMEMLLKVASSIIKPERVELQVA